MILHDDEPCREDLVEEIITETSTEGLKIAIAVSVVLDLVFRG